MKTEFKTPEEYLLQTEHAVRHFYTGLDSCWTYYKKALQHWNISMINEPLTAKRKADLDRYLRLAGKYFDLKFSEATFAGSILQVAAMGIRSFSQNKTIPEACKSIVNENHKTVIPFCIGKEIHGLPTGLIIYAARNQYNHLDEKPWTLTKKIFERLSEAFTDDVTYDLAFDIANPTITSYAGEVLLNALRWRTYDTYHTEMSDLLTVVST